MTQMFNDDELIMIKSALEKLREEYEEEQKRTTEKFGEHIAQVFVHPLRNINSALKTLREHGKG